MNVISQKKKSAWSVYVIETGNGSLYTGITTDVERRFQEHQGGNKQAKFFRTTAVKRIVHIERYETRSQASKRESEIKRMSKSAKLLLINA